MTLGELRKLAKDMRKTRYGISVSTFRRALAAVEELLTLKEKPVDAIADAAAICQKRGL